METWSDQGIVLGARAHGEGGSVVTVLTEEHGLYSGYLPGGMSKSRQGLREIGNLVKVEWQARLQEYLGRFTLDLEAAHSAPLLSDRKRLQAMKSACALCKTSLPEREANPAQFHGLLALLNALPNDEWGQVYIAWEIGFLNEQGCPLDFTCCASTGQMTDLVYVSPKSGRAVSREAGAPYKDKLLALPDFLRRPEDRDQQKNDDEQLAAGLKLTGYFIENRVYGQTTVPVPDDRLRLAEMIVPD